MLIFLSALFHLLNEILNAIFVSFFFFLDFDEQTADDWDVDMSVYYDKGTSGLFYIVITLIYV